MTLLDVGRVVRFGAVGFINTVVGYAVIVTGLALGLGDVVSNMIGYACGLALGYALNARWTFADRAVHGRLPRYVVAFIIAYGANLAVVLAMRAAGFIDHPFSHLVSAVVYSLLFYALNARFVFHDRGGATSTGGASGNHWPELLLGLLLLLSLPLLWRMPISHDVVWQMWIARQLNGGVRLYTDILEINPPLWFWMAMPVERLAQVLDIPAAQAIVTAVLALAGLALALLAALLADESPRRRAVLLGAAFAALVVIPLSEFAQREHIALIAALPYLVLAARRAQGRATSLPLTLAVGLLAAAGFALKHYFVLVPLLLELWLLLRLRRSYAPFRPETLMLALCALMYAAAVVLFAPDFLSVIVPRVVVAYHGYEAPMTLVLTRGWCLLWLAGFVAAVRFRDVLSPLAMAGLLTALGFMVGYVAQAKGWGYHALPATGAVVFAVAAMLRRGRDHLDYAWAGTVLVLAMGITLMRGPYGNRNDLALEAILRDHPGSSVLALTSNPSYVWPAVEVHGNSWISRHFAFWMLRAMAMELTERGGVLTPELDAAARTMRTETYDDMLCHPPDLILAVDVGYKGRRLDVKTFFERDERLRHLFSFYEQEESREHYRVYRRARDWDIPPEGPCRPLF